MAKKRQPKHTKKAAKQQRSPSHAPRFAPPSPQTRPAIKISEAILTLTEPLRAHYREPHRLQAIVAIAVMAWNISLFPDEEQSHVQGMLLERLPPQLGGEDMGVLLSTIDTLIARKHLLYPQVREYILTHNLPLVDNKVTLTVGTAPVPEKNTAKIIIILSCGHAQRDRERAAMPWQESLSIRVSEQEAKNKESLSTLPSLRLGLLKT